MKENTRPRTTGPLADKTTMDLSQIMQILPHRQPFLLLDRVLDIERRKRLVAIKNVTTHEAPVAGQVPGAPVMPNTLIVETMAQAGGILLLLEEDDPKSKLLMFTGIEAASFTCPVVLGDQLRVVAEPTAWRSNAVRMNGTAFVGKKRVAKAVISCMLVDRSRLMGVASGESAE